MGKADIAINISGNMGNIELIISSIWEQFIR